MSNKSLSLPKRRHPLRERKRNATRTLSGGAAMLLAASAILVAACQADRIMDPETEASTAADDQGTGSGGFAMTCTADLESEEIRCGTNEGRASLGEGSAAIILGGQNQFITLASTNVCFECPDTDIFQADVTIKNLILQPIGTPDADQFGSTILVFFHTGPTNGVTVDNADGSANFTSGTLQPYITYSPLQHFNVETSTIWLDPNETSGARTWRFDTSGMSGGTTFSFTVLLFLDVPFPNGWVDISPDPAAVAVSSTVNLTATVRDVVGRAVSGRTVTWSSATPGLATVNSSGLVTAGSSNETASIEASSDGPEATGTAAVKIYQDLAARTPTVISGSINSERNYRFVVPSGGASPAAVIRPAAGVRILGGPARVSENDPMGGMQLGTGAIPSSAGQLASQPSIASVLGLGIDETSTASRDGPGGADLYVKFGAPPTTTDYHCRPFIINSREACAFDDPAAGDWFMTVRGGSGFTDVEVNGDFGETATGYTMEVEFLTTMTTEQQQAVQDAASRWEAVITGDIRPVAVFLHVCGTGNRVNRVVDDLAFFVRTEAVDGVGNKLAFAGPCRLRSTTEDEDIPATGVITIDTADLSSGLLVNMANLEAVVTHELGHAMGMPTLWGGLLSGAGTSDPTFTGPLAIAAYATVGGPASTPVPVEGSTGNPGTDDAHWRESVFDTELMTGFFDGPSDALSVVTVQSFADVGYTVNTAAADSYTLPSPPGPDAQGSQGIPYGNDVTHEFTDKVDETGRNVPIERR